MESASSLGAGTSWQDLQSGIVTQDGTLQVTVPASQPSVSIFYRVRGTGWPGNMALIPAGSFEMGDGHLPLEGASDGLPVHIVYVSAFYMDRYEVTRALWDEVSNWAVTNGYSFDYDLTGKGKATNHPAHSMLWYNAVKWCNARSEKEGKTPAYYTDAGLMTPYRTSSRSPYVNWNSGYRLPTEAEWEKAARGGSSGHRFPWSDIDTISHSRANYACKQLNGTNVFVYDVSLTPDNHPTFNDGTSPYTSPAGYFAPNGYGLCDIAGNVFEWCWDWYSATYYSSSPSADPKGPATGSSRVVRGGSWSSVAINCRVPDRVYQFPNVGSQRIGFRTVLPAGQ